MLKYIKNLLKTENPASASLLFSDSNGFDFNSSTGNMDLVLENSCINRSLSLIVNAITNLNLLILKNGVEDSSSLVSKILSNPSSSFSFSFSDFLESFVWSYLIYGNSYVVLTFVDSKFELLNLNSPSISILLDKSKSRVEGYSYLTSDNKTTMFINNSDFPFVGHFKNFNPKNQWYGYSFIDPIRTSATLYQQIDKHNTSVVRNGGRPSGVLSISPSKMLTEKEKSAFSKTFNDKYSGSDNAGQILFLNGDCQWHQLSGNVKDMDYSEASRRAIRSISSGLGVPANLVGDLSLSGENSRSNMDALFDIFNKSTVTPLAKKISQFFTLFFNKSLGENIEIRLVEDKVS